MKYHVVKKPKHYTNSKIETIDFIEDKGFNYHLGNTIKYLSRAGRKDSSKFIEDLEKGSWYLSRYIKYLKREK
jgi:hypothetical protein